MSPPLAGLRVVVTRERLEPLGTMLRDLGAEPVHLPAIAVTDPADGGAELAERLRRLDHYDWLVVTSPNGADRVGPAAAASAVRLAAVGTATGDRLARLAGRPADLVPDVQEASALAAALLAELAGRKGRVLLAQADRASPRLAEALLAAGLDVDVCTAYRTVTTPPDLTGLATRPADALLLASGSAAAAWATAVEAGGEGADRPMTPPVVVAIGPSTAAAARRCGLDISAVATDHSLGGLLDALVRSVRG